MLIHLIYTELKEVTIKTQHGVKLEQLRISFQMQILRLVQI